MARARGAIVRIIPPQSDATGLSRAGWTDAEFFKEIPVDGGHTPD